MDETLKDFDLTIQDHKMVGEQEEYDISAMPLQSNPISDQTAEQRAIRYDFALGDKSQGLDKVKAILQSPGGEDQLREQAALDEEAKRKQAALELYRSGEATAGNGQQLEDIATAAQTPVSRETAMEKKFAEATIGTSLSLTENPDEVNEAQEEMPEMSQGMYDFYVDSITLKQGLNKIAEDAEDIVSKMNYSDGNYIYQRGKTLIPLYSWSSQRNDTLGESLDTWMQGSNKEQQYAVIKGMKAEEGIALAKAIYQEIAASNPLEARDWAVGLTAYTAGDVDNAFGLIDLASVTPIGMARKLVAKGATSAGRLAVREVRGAAAIRAANRINRVPAFGNVEEAKASLEKIISGLQGKQRDLLVSKIEKGRGGNPLQSAVVGKLLDKTIEDTGALERMLKELKTVKANKAAPLLERIRRTAISVSDKHLSFPEMMSSMGHVERASRLQAMEWGKKLAGKATQTFQEGLADVGERVPSLFNPNFFITDASQFSKVRTKRLMDFVASNQDAIARASAGVMNVSRLPLEVENLALDVAEAGIKDQFKSVPDAILHAVTRVNSESNTLTNSAYVEAVIGKPDGTLFASAKIALNHAKNRYNLSVTERDIFQEGDGYVIRLRKDIDETEDRIRDGLITTGNTSDFTSPKLFGIIPLPKSTKKLQGAKDTFSKFQNEQRAVTAHAQTMIQALFKQTAEVLGNLSKREKAALDKIMKINRDFERIPGKGETRGMFYQNTFELEQAYQQHIKRLPTDNEVAAYVAEVQRSDADYLVKTLSQYTVKSRLGIERLTTTHNGKELTFEGKVLDSIPFDSTYEGSVFLKTTSKDPGKYMLTKKVGNAQIINKAIKDQNLRIIQTHNPEAVELRGTFGVSGPVNYIVVPELKTGPLKLSEQVSYRPGFHVAYKDEFFIKQPVLYRDSSGRQVYSGDVVALGVSNTAKGGKEVALLERARLAVLSKDDTLLKSVLDEGLPYTVSEFKKLFKTRFDVKTPFALVKQGENAGLPSVKLGNGKSLQEHAGHYEDFSNSPLNLSKQTTDDFLGSKDGPLYSIANKGTEDNPIWVMDEARTIDPIATQVEAMGRLIRDKHYNDYKISAAESFIQEFGVKKGLMYLNGKPMMTHDLRRNPAWAVANAEIRGTGMEAIVAKNAQKAIANLTSHPSLIGSHLANAQAKLLSMTHLYAGEKYVNIVDDWSASLKTDLPSKFRALAFHTKLGLFNPVQVFLQGQTLGNIQAIAPMHGPGGTMVSAWMRRLDLLPGDTEALASMAKSASKITRGWNEKMFLESYDGLKRSGFDLIGGDLSWRNDIGDPKVFQGKVGKFLDWSALLFNGTERFVRLASWNTAYAEYAGKMPKLVGKMTDNDYKAILVRAQQLSGNMTRDSHAFWQEGYASTATQFWGYSGRMFDLMVGNRLTPAEKARLVSFWSVMYGVPTATTASLPIWPFSDSIRQMLFEHDTNPDEGLTGLIMNGMLAQSIAGMTGEQYDIGTRWGPGAIQVLWDLSQDKRDETGLDILGKMLGGASGSIALDIARSASPVLGDVADMISGDGGETVLLEDVTSLLSDNVSSAGLARRAWSTFNYGMYVDKNKKTKVEGLESWEGVFHGLTGLEKIDIKNGYILNRSSQDKKADEAYAMKKASEYIRLFYQANSEGNREAALDYKAKVQAIRIGANLTEKQMSDLFDRVRKEKTYLDTSVKNYQEDALDQPQKNTRIEMFQ